MNSGPTTSHSLFRRLRKIRRWSRISVVAVAAATLLLIALSTRDRWRNARVEANTPSAASVGVATVVPKTLSRKLTLSSELVPFQEIDVYAKESGYVTKLYVDYGTRVKAGQLMATLEIPELEAQLQVDAAEIANATDRVTRAQHDLKRYKAQYNTLHLESTRLSRVFESQPGIVAQQEVDDAQGKDLAAAAQVDASEAAQHAAQSYLNVAKAKRERDQTLYDYSRITAPFAGVVTNRDANLGTLVQAGTSSRTQAMPIVRLSEDDLFRLVMPVPESYVRFIHIGEPVEVRVPSLNRSFPGKVARFSVDVKESTRTMHTEVDIPNPAHLLMPGIYAEADLLLEQKQGVAAVPLQAVNREGNRTTVYVVNKGDTIEQRTVTLGLETASDAEVISGLRSGEQVVVSDRSGLKPGLRVRPQQVQPMQY
jgi:RND family efflux transporter MFP subunit